MRGVRIGWECAAGRRASDVAYWDVIAAINTPTILRRDPGFGADSAALDTMAVTGRRDAFLRAAVSALP